MGENADIVRRAFDAFSRRDLTVLLTLTDPEMEFMPATARVAGRAEPYRGHDGLRTYLADVARTAISARAGDSSAASQRAPRAKL